MRWSSSLRVLVIVLVAVAAAIALAACAAPSHSGVRYHCPMHPDYVSDRPGDCPICGMKLVPMEKDSPKQSSAPIAPAVTPAVNTPQASERVAPGAKIVYTCPHHPEVQQDKPGTCPKCGMDLERKEVRGPALAAASLTSDIGHRTSDPQSMPGMPGMSAAPAPPPAQGDAHKQAAPAVPGLAPVHADGEAARLAGVQTVAAAMGTVTGTIRAVGTVVTPETGVRQVTTKVAGWIEKLYVNSVGRPVRAGEPLFELYSPELLASQEEYLKARQVASRFAQSSLPEVQHGGEDLASAARRRLELFDVPPEFITHLEQTGKPQRTVTFRAPFGGYVMEKNVLEGQQIQPGMSVLTIADLSRAWVTAQLYEAEAAAARPGRTATVTSAYDATVKLTGRVDLVYPTLDADTRTIKVRLQFPNPRLALKPGMFVNVELQAERAQGIIVPDSALIDTGTRQVVFVQSAPGHFEPRDVKVGLRSDGKVVLRSGVSAGEQVAVAANFLLDSESRLRAGINAATHKHE